MSTANEYRAARRALDFGRGITALFILIDRNWCYFRDDPKATTLPWAEVSEPAIWTIDRLRQRASTIRACSVSSQDDLFDEFESKLAAAWSNLEEHVAARTEADAELSELPKGPHWTELGWKEVETVISALVRTLPELAGACFNAGAVFEFTPRSKAVTLSGGRSDGFASTPWLVDAAAQQHLPVEFATFGQLIMDWANVILGELFAQFRCWLPELRRISPDLSAESHKRMCEQGKPYTKWALGRLGHIYDALNRALVAAEDGARRQFSDRTEDPSRESASLWWHNAREPLPEKYRYGPLEGTQKELARAILPPSSKADIRSLHKRCQDGMYWAVKLGRVHYAIWFSNEVQFTEAKKRHCARIRPGVAPTVCLSPSE